MERSAKEAGGEADSARVSEARHANAINQDILERSVFELVEEITVELAGLFLDAFRVFIKISRKVVSMQLNKATVFSGQELVEGNAPVDVVFSLSFSANSSFPSAFGAVIRRGEEEACSMLKGEWKANSAVLLLVRCHALNFCFLPCRSYRWRLSPGQL